MKKPILKRWWFWVIIVIVIIGFAGASGSDDKKVTKDTSTKLASTEGKTEGETEDKTEEKTEETKVTYDNFFEIKMGMKYADVVKILGEGTQSSSSEISGIKTSMYSWNGAGISNMNVTIQNGIVTGKAQAGLKEPDANVTLEKFNSIKSGMTYDKVKSILGEGEIVSQTKIMNMKSIMYSWINRNGANMNCTFSDGKLQSKAQIGLK